MFNLKTSIEKLILTCFLPIFIYGCSEQTLPAGREGDLIAFRTGMLEVDNSFSIEAKAAAYEKFHLLKTTAEDMSDAEFGLALAEITAMANNGHTLIDFDHFALRRNRLAVQFYIADDGLFIADAMPKFKNLIGQKIQTIEGMSLSQIRDHFKRYLSGRAGWLDYSMYRFIESPELLFAAKISASPDSVDLLLENGESLKVGISADWPKLKGDKRWTFTREMELAINQRIQRIPIYLQNPLEVTQVVDLPKFDAVYIQFRSNAGTDFSQTVRQIQKDLNEKKPQHIIVDQRFNSGGDLLNTRKLMNALPDIIADDGKIIVITSGRTFSAAITSIGFLKQAGGDKVVIVGAPIGDELEFWAEGGSDVFKLPDLGAYFLPAIKRHNYKDGCFALDCFLPMILFSIKVDSLDPDIQPARNFDEIINGGDPYLDAAIKLIEKSR